MAERMAEKARAAANAAAAQATAAAKGTRDAVGSLAAEFETNMETSALGAPGGRSSTDGGSRPSVRSSSGRPPRAESPDGDHYVKLPVASAKKLKWYDDGDIAEVIAAHLREKMALSEEMERLRSELEKEIGKDEVKRRLSDEASVAKTQAAERARQTEDGANRVLLLSAREEITRLRVALETGERKTVKGDAGKKKAGPGSEGGSEQDGWNDGWDGSDDGGFEPFDEPPASPTLPASTAPGASTPMKTDDDISAMSKLTKANEKLAATVSKLESKLADAERARDDAEAEANAAADELAELQKEVNAAPGTPSKSRTATSHDDPNEITFGTVKTPEPDADQLAANEALKDQLETLRAEAESKGVIGAELEAEVDELRAKVTAAEAKVVEAERQLAGATAEASAALQKAEEAFDKKLEKKDADAKKAKTFAEELLKKNQALTADLSEAVVRADAFAEKADELEKSLLKERERRVSDGELATEHEAALAKAEKDAEWAVARVEELEAKLAERAEDVEDTEDFAAAAEQTIKELEKAVEAAEAKATQAEEAKAAAIVEAEEAKASAEEAKASAEEAKASAETRCEEMKKRTSKAEIDAKALRGTVDDLKQQIATHAKRKQDAKKLSDDLAAAIKAKETAETEAAAAKDAVKETEAKLEGLQKSSKKTKHELDEAAANVADLKAKLDAASQLQRETSKMADEDARATLSDKLEAAHEESQARAARSRSCRRSSRL